jgi:hypothetical protein
MPVPESLETASAMTVKRHRGGIGRKPISFGEWQVVDFHRERFPSRTRSAISVAPITFAKYKGDAEYRFVLTPSARDEWECNCRHERNHQNIGVGPVDSPLEVELTYDESLECDLQRIGDDEMWKLHVVGSLAIGGEGYTGTLTHGTYKLALQPSHAIARFHSVPGPPTGYRFEREGVQVASAELLPPGFVRIGDEAGDDRDAIATAAAALLMQPGAF